MVNKIEIPKEQRGTTLFELPPKEKTLIFETEDLKIEPETFYIVDVAWSESNPIHQAIFYSGLKPIKKDGKVYPGNYCGFYNPSYDSSYHSMHKVWYFRLRHKIAYTIKNSSMHREIIPSKENYCEVGWLDKSGPGPIEVKFDETTDFGTKLSDCEKFFIKG